MNVGSGRILEQSMPSAQFAFADGVQRACRHCATLARAETRYIFERGWIPRPEDETATVTFVRFEGKTYAVTARHVIEGFQRLAAKHGIEHEGYYLPTGRGVGIQPPFIVPPQSWQGAVPDVAMRPIDDALPAHIGKEAFEFREDIRPIYPIPYGAAVGFPTAAKSDRLESMGKQLAMQCVHAIAEGLPAPDFADQLQFYSEIESQPAIGSLSGLSGGPVFWSDSKKFGLLGFVKQALDLEPVENENIHFGPRVHFLIQHATYEIFGLWAEHTQREWPKRRDELNEWAAQKQKPV